MTSCTPSPSSPSPSSPSAGSSSSLSSPPSSVPGLRGVPAFPPVRVRRGAQRLRLRRAMRRRRRSLAAGLAMTAAALAAMGQGLPGGSAAAGPPTASASAAASGDPAPRPVRMVAAPVRIADAATVRLLRPGDRVDVIAAANSPTGEAGEPRVVATGARVARVPQSRETSPDGGALVVLSVPRSTATALAGAGASSRLAVTLC
ncbi:hypothetical protein GCM10014713_64060 [Streptomyces purpureus]|uniref:Flp pilus assembly protein RcpC/CpaB domain-containing protein n=1 Tax=Streptomyces purpureus TaxID=1951 RepID=A0A918LWZ5_9ACTN|nr:hypothetical protein [Streptomyces purpureus]GGT61802.1 hypothetical protein GCM10014713_64060 [Streptomyces purpureus]